MDNELNVLWTNDNLITAEKMVFLYSRNSLKKGWWEKVTIIIWGAAAKLTAENSGVQKKITEMIKDGVIFSSCRACADQLGVTAILENMGIEVKYWGEDLTELIKSGKHLLTL